MTGMCVRPTCTGSRSSQRNLVDTETNLFNKRRFVGYVVVYMDARQPPNSSAVCVFVFGADRYVIFL